ncbi:MAG: hypothetical protein Q8Q50_09260 [Methylobacter sp.]|nr:hypothetical protein [Methylobacter sp.]
MPRNLQQITLSTCPNGVRDTELSIWNTDYRHLLARLVNVAVGDKDGSYFVRPTGTKRTNSDTADNADILILDGDKRIDRDTGEVLDGAPDPALVHGVLKAASINHIIFTSYSNGKDGADFYKYRVVILIKYNRAQLATLLDHIHERLHNAGVMLFNVPENRSWAQAWYFPRCPQERLHLFQSFHYLDGAVLDAGQWCTDYLAKHPAPAEPTANKSAPARLKSAQNRVDPIRLFNNHWKSPVNYLLTQGYKPKGNRLLHPLSQSKVAGVQICKSCADGVERVFSHGGSDPLSNGYAHDAFDCFAILEHGGNLLDALLDIARTWTVNGMTIESFNRMMHNQGGSL